ncbi:LysM peptidoglycan-binding domain-containing protein [Solibacillus sp. FSL H8-0538]|uniref:LysM peptidoglycan-binding domain-containing protein n=1 Tax=Solibacillus sp. FSL H8-0538 TaxID=2921400 RepID=UPI0030FBA203
MTKKDYREKVEEHRQEIELKNEPTSRMSRSNRHKNKKTKKQRNPLMSILTVVFIFIPLTILGYVWFFYDPAEEEVVKKDDDNFVVQLEKNEPAESSGAVIDESQEKDPEQKDEADADANEQAVKEEAAAEEAQKLAAQKAKEEEAKKKAEEAQANEQQKTHTVQSTDNLYRIALKYYNDGSGSVIDKIKRANNLSSDSISAGQVLIIP